MPSHIDEPPALREGRCPFCEHRVLVYEDPARCPLCACPLDETRMRPYSFPGSTDEPSPEGSPAG